MKTHRWLLAVALLAAACANNQSTNFPTPAPRTVMPGLPRTATAPPSATAPATTPPTETPAATSEATAAVTEAPGAGADTIATIAPGAPITITAIEMFDASTGWAIGGTGRLGDHILRTDDGGTTWADVTPPNPAALRTVPGFPIGAHAHFADAQTGWVIYGTTGAGLPQAIPVWRTQDGGASWTSSEPIDASDLGTSDFFAPSDLHFVDEQHGFFMTHLGVGMNHDYIAIYATADGGATWAPVFSPATGEPQSCGKTGLRFVDAQRGWLTGDCQGVTPGVFFYATTDGGASWQPVELPAPAGNADLFTRQDAGCGTNSLTVFDAQTANLSVACLVLSTEPIETRAFIYATDDGGDTWTSAPAPSRGLTFINPQVGWSLPLTLGFSNQPFSLERTTDGGATWLSIASVPWYGQPDFVDEALGWNVALTADDISLVHTTDGGATWAALEPVIGP